MLNPTMQRMTAEFINMMFSIGLSPQITKPSRIVNHRATLIDRIFSNDMENKNKWMNENDMSDHIPIFAIFNHD